MSDHERFASTGTMSDVENDISDEMYMDAMMTGKPKPVTTTRRLDSLPLQEIGESLECGVYAGIRGTPEFIRQAREDISICPIAPCRFEHFDRYELAQHIQQHPEIIAFRENVLRDTRSIETLRERRTQLEDSMQRLKVEVKTLDDRIHKFDLKSLRDRQKQISELSRILSS